MSSKSLNGCRKAITKAVEAEQQWQATVAAKTAELSDLEARSGREIIDAGEDGDRVAARLVARFRGCGCTSRRRSELPRRLGGRWMRPAVSAWMRLPVCCGTVPSG